MVRDELLILFLQRLLEGRLIIEEEEEFKETENCEKTSNLRHTIHNCQGRDLCLVERIVVISVLKEDSHMGCTEIFEFILIIGLCKGEIKACYY